MEYAKEDVFKIRYNETSEKSKSCEENWTSKLKGKIRNHKLFSTIVLALLIFSTINIIMIYNFMNVLQKI